MFSELLHARHARVIWVSLVVLSLLITPGTVAAVPQSPNQITLRIQTPDYEVTADGVSVPGFPLSRTPGAPRLPVHYTVVELPPSGNWSLSLETPGARILEQTAQIAPAPTPIGETDEPQVNSGVDGLPPEPIVGETPDPLIYGTDAFYPQSVVIAGEVQSERGRRLLPIQVFPFQYNPVTGALRYAPDIAISVSVEAGAGDGAQRAVSEFAQSNPPATGGSALRIYTHERGMHRLTYSNLADAGVPLASVSISSFAMYYLGQPVDIQVTDANGNGFFEPGDLVRFYAEPNTQRYMTDNVYWFSYASSPGARMQTRAHAPSGSEPVVTSITQSSRVEVENVYVSKINRPADESRYYDQALYANPGSPVSSRTYDLAVNDLVPAASATLRALMFGGLAQAPDPDNSVAIRVNGNAAGTYQWEGETGYTASVQVPGNWLAAPNTQVTLEAALGQLPQLAQYWVYPDWVELTYTATADAENDRIYIEAAPTGANEVVVTGFTTSEARVYDVRDPRRPVQITSAAAQPASGGFAIHFWDDNLPNPTYYVSTDAALLAPVAIRSDVPSNWGSPAHNASYIAIVHRDLWGAVQPLLDHRQAEGMAVAKVDVQDLYDEFSYGRENPQAIRDFLNYAYHNWNSGGAPPAYVLLVGDGHHDFKGVEGSTLKNLIPPYLVHIDPWIGETAADNRYVSVDGPSDVLPEMHIGRISAQTPKEVTNYVNKVLAYEGSVPDGAWQNNVTFVADDCNNSVADFNAISELVRKTSVPSGFQSERLYFRIPQTGDNCPDANYTSASLMRGAIKNAYNSQNLLIQWFGHGSRFRWGSVSLFNQDDIPTLAPNSVWPMVMHYTCYTGYFHNVYQSWQSLAETELLAEGKGSIVSFAATGQHLGTDELVMNLGVNQALFDSHHSRIGQVIDSARQYYFVNSPVYLDLIDSSVLFGDPALKLRVPTASNRSFVPLILR